MSRTPFIRLILLAALLLVAGPLQAVTLKIATQAPDGTTWMKEMRAGAKEIGDRTGGRVRIKFYPGGVMGNYKSVMKKIRLGQLQGGAVTGDDIASLYPPMRAYSMPMIFQGYDEVDHVRKHVDARLIEGIEKKGFVMLGITEGGFAYLMSNGPLRGIADLKSHKLWLPEGDELNEALFRKMGVSPISLPLSDVYTGLQTGLIDTIGATTAGALAFQWHTRIEYVTDVPLIYLVGVLIVDKKRFDRIKPADQKVVKEVISRIFMDMNQKNRDDNEKARHALENLGIEFVVPDASEQEHRRKLAREVISETVNREPDLRETYVEVERLLNEFERLKTAGKH